MSYNKKDLIQYRLEKAWTTYNEAKSLAGSGFWDGAANRLYYSCFYAVIALLVHNDISATTHNGVRTEFFRNYIKTGILDKKYSRVAYIQILWGRGRKVIMETSKAFLRMKYHLLLMRWNPLLVK